MTRTLINISVLGAAAVALAACGGGGGKGPGGGGGGGPGPGPGTPSAKLEDSFGGGFAAAFQKGAHTDPREPAAGDVVAASLTTDPVPVP